MLTAVLLQQCAFASPEVWPDAAFAMITCSQLHLQHATIAGKWNNMLLLLQLLLLRSSPSSQHATRAT
jgi:hypothetical protein